MFLCIYFLLYFLFLSHMGFAWNKRDWLYCYMVQWFYRARHVSYVSSVVLLRESRPSVFRGLRSHTVWVKKKFPLGDLTFFHFFHKRLRIFNRFFTHLLNVPIFARLQIFIPLSPILTKLCYIKRDYAVHIICAKRPKRAKTRAFRRLRKSLIALLIVVFGKSL